MHELGLSQAKRTEIIWKAGLYVFPFCFLQELYMCNQSPMTHYSDPTNAT